MLNEIITTTNKSILYYNMGNILCITCTFCGNVMDSLEISTFDRDRSKSNDCKSPSEFEKIRHRCKFYESSNPTQNKIFTIRKNKLCCGRFNCLQQYEALLNEPI